MSNYKNARSLCSVVVKMWILSQLLCFSNKDNSIYTLKKRCGENNLVVTSECFKYVKHNISGYFSIQTALGYTFSLMVHFNLLWWFWLLFCELFYDV